jgi:beta-glucosidase-like glycosyl hydrolase
MANSVTAEQIRQRANVAEQQGNRALAQQLRESAEQQALNDVFGVGFKRDRNGNPIERGIGSDSNITTQHIDAVRKYEGEAAAEAIIARATKAGLWPPKRPE